MIKEILFVFIGALLITACTPQPADSSGKRGLGRNRYTSTTRKHSSKKDTVKKKKHIANRTKVFGGRNIQTM